MSAYGGSHPLVPGWYRDPANDEVERFWNGNSWTEKSRPAPLLMPPPAMPQRNSQWQPRAAREPVSAVVFAGYFFAVAMPLLGFILGLTQINRSQHGLRIVIGSVLLFCLYFKLLYS